MTAQDDAAALSSAEKRHLSADSDDNAAQHPKRTRLSPLLQPDVAKAPSPLTGWLDTVLDCFDASEVTPSWEQQPRPDTNKETIHHDDWHANDVSIGTWSHGQASLGSFRSPSHNLQADEIYSNVGQAGYENGIGENLDSDGQLDWGTCAWPEYEAMDLSPAMDFSYEPDEPKNPTIQATLQVPTTLGPSNTSTTRFDSGNTKRAEATENTELIELDGYYDACFGVIHTHVVTSFTRKEDKAPVPVRLRPSANFLKIYFEDSNKYAGIVTMPALSRLLTEFTTKFDATLNTPPDLRTKVSRKKGNAANTYKSNSQASLRIVVYGIMEESSKIGKLLSDADLYLQHPTANECDMDVEYFNPHFLVRPGSHMPRLAELEISSNNANTASSGTIDEKSKNRLMQIFDSAYDDGIMSTTAPSPRLRASLKPHQLTALTMMSERECGLVANPQFPSTWERSTLFDGTTTYRHRITGRTESRPSVALGGILADEMGLGKTLSLLSLICWSIDVLGKDKATKSNERPSSTLVVTPKSTIHGWEEQIRRHIFSDQIRFTIYHGTGRQGLASDFWSNDIVLTTYETMRSDFENKGPLYAERWFRVVLDEAHHIGNRSTMKFRAACGIQAPRRWCLTGTPIHNSLDNYGALLSFVGVSPFIEKPQFDLWIANPIKEKRPNSWKKLQLLVRGTSLRRTKQVMDQSLELPPREEKIELIDLNQSERELYEFFRQQTAAVAAGFWQQGSTHHPPAQRKDKNMLSLINLLRLVCNYGDLLSTSALSAWRARKTDAIDWRLMRSSTNTCAICRAGLEESSEQFFESTRQCGHPVCAMCFLETQDGDMGMDDSCSRCSAGDTTGNDGTMSCFFRSDIPSSSKIDALLRNLRLEQGVNQQGCMEPPIKSIVFSYWTKMLDLVQKALQSSGFHSQRLDGQMSLQSRSTAIRQFAENPRCTVLLATINCAGEGIDLTAANCVHLIEPHWNPMVEAQAIARVHRIGQSRPVLATKYVTRNSIEEYVRWVQEDKLKLVARSLNFDGICQKGIEDERWKKLKALLGKQDNS